MVLPINIKFNITNLISNLGRSGFIAIQTYNELTHFVIDVLLVRCGERQTTTNGPSKKIRSAHFISKNRTTNIMDFVNLLFGYNLLQISSNLGSKKSGYMLLLIFSNLLNII